MRTLHGTRVRDASASGSVFGLRASGIGRTLLYALGVGLVAHLALDRLANLLSAPDPYDDLQHPSRFPVALLVATVLGIGALRAFYGALVDASRDGGRLRRPFVRAHPFARAALDAWIGGSIAMAALEACDALAATRPVPSFDALLAGSPPLAFAVTAVVALLVTAIVRAALRGIAALRPALAFAIAFLLTAARDAGERAEAWRAFARCGAERREPRWIRAGKRGPPTLQEA